MLKGDLTKVKKHLKTLRAKMTHASRQDNKFQQDAQVNTAITASFEFDTLLTFLTDI